MPPPATPVPAAANHVDSPLSFLSNHIKRVFHPQGGKPDGRSALDDLEVRCIELWELLGAARDEALHGEGDLERIAAMMRGAQALLATTAEPMAAVRTALERAR